MAELWAKTVSREFETRRGVFHAEVTRTELLERLHLVRYYYKLGEHEWVVETERGNRQSLFDFIAWKYFTGTYLQFAQWLALRGEPDDELEAVYLSQLSLLGDEVTVVVDPLWEGRVELLFFIGGRRYFVSVTPQTPVGLLARLALEVRKG